MNNKTKPKLPQIPSKRYFTIGEVSFLCGVRAHVLRYWEQEFPQLKPSKRRGNRRYYQREDVIMVRNIRGLLYDEGYTISGARAQLMQMVKHNKREASYDKLVLAETSDTENYCSITELEYLAEKLRHEHGNSNNINYKKYQQTALGINEVIIELKSILAELEAGAEVEIIC